MSIGENLLEVRAYDGIGYEPIIDYGAWRVAILRYHPELEPQAINALQRHDETDEVFVLLAGRCILFIAEGTNSIGEIHAIDMQPLLAYNVKKGAWHSHTLSHDATVLIVENRDTQNSNSPIQALTPAQQAMLPQLTAQIWGA